MWIEFAFGKKNSRYRLLLDDYMQRIARFAKLGTEKNGGLALCFVASENLIAEKHPVDVNRSAAGDAGKTRPTFPKVHRLRSEELAALIEEIFSGAAGDRVQRMYGCELKSPSLQISVCTNVEDLRPEEGGRTAYVELVRAKITRELSEVLAAEQIYRAFMIMNNRTYHK